MELGEGRQLRLPHRDRGRLVGDHARCRADAEILHRRGAAGSGGSGKGDRAHVAPPADPGRPGARRLRAERRLQLRLTGARPGTDPALRRERQGIGGRDGVAG